MPRFSNTAGRLTYLLALGFVTAGCHTGSSEGLDISTLPANVQADYRVFAVRCSKCHSLARPLESGISNDAYWAEYVERMRRQPASGISPVDVAPILRFLHYYSSDRKDRQHAGGALDGGK